jgi:site-specific DNA-cytosine methylase
MTTVGSLFSGAGLLDLGLTLAGFDVIWHAETDRAASQVLKRHWPGAPNLGDVSTIDWGGGLRARRYGGRVPMPAIQFSGQAPRP